MDVRIKSSRRKGWDRDFRPRSYWLQDTKAYITARPKGTARRRLLKDPVAAGLDGDWLSQASLPDAERKAWGMVHPSMMGGEYLPDLEEGEVEIARIELQSVTGDVISLRARPDGAGRIRYRFCDEYPEDERVYLFSPADSAQPLSFGELADLLEGATTEGTVEGYEGLIWGLLDWHSDQGWDSPRELERFVHLESPFYPDLTPYFEWRIRQWLAGILRKRRAEDRT